MKNNTHSRLKTAVTAAACVAGLALGGAACSSSASSGHHSKAPAPLILGYHVQESPDWSGYVSHSQRTYTFVQAHWIVPKVKCPRTGVSVVANWVGLNGWVKGSVQQGGTQSYCVSGHAYYFAWAENFPHPTHVINDTVKPGDKMSELVNFIAPDQYYVNLRDNTQEWGYVKEYIMHVKPASAEVITEAPAKGPRRGSPIYPLADFGRTAYTQVTDDGHSLSHPVRLTIFGFKPKNRDKTSVLHDRGFYNTWVSG
jgi:hypothetical protein